MKRAKARGGKGTARKAAFEKELGVLQEVEHAYSWLAEGAENVARGESANVALDPGAWIWHLAELAAEFSAKHPSRWRRTPTPFPDPCGGLGEAGRKLVHLDSRRGEETARAEAARLAAEWRRMQGATGALHHSILIMEQLRAEGAAEVAGVRAKLAKVKGDKAAERKWKRKQKSEREAVRALEVSRLLKAGWTVQQVADKIGLSVATVERAAKLARAWNVLKERTPGRRKDAMNHLDKGAAASRAIDNATGQAWDD